LPIQTLPGGGVVGVTRALARFSYYDV